MQKRNNNVVIDLREEVLSSVKYVCRREDLDKLLPHPTGEDSNLPDLRAEFQSLFYDPATLHMDGSGKVVGEPVNKSVWRMFYSGNDPAKFLSRFGIDILNPTVRDAVALDLVKLDDDSVSNDSDYLYKEHLRYSPMEYERLILNRNFRVNLVSLNPEWSKINYLADDEGESEIPDLFDGTLNSSSSQLGENDEGYEGSASFEIKRSIESMYQGVHVSETLLDFFGQLFYTAFDEDGNLVEDVDAANSVYVPFTNSTDFITEVALIPNTRADFKPITTRAYYDMKYGKYKKLLVEKGINAIATFALVDPEKDKNHTGQYLIKVQKKVDDGYLYLVMKFDKDGQLVDSPVPFKSDKNTILCVCEDDFRADRTVPGQQEVWEPEIRDVPMVQSTTSSHYSVFRQRIPEYDLKEVRHYLQFKNRLEGMELFLEMQKRDLWRKEVQASESFAKETMAIWWLFQEFGQNEKLMQLVMEYYRLMSEWDDLIVKRAQLKFIKDEKKQHLDELLEQYASLDNTKLDRKLELGHKIKSVKMEIGKGIQTSIDEINQNLDKIRRRVDEINEQVSKIKEDSPIITDDNGAVICTELEKTFSLAPDSEFQQVIDSFIQAADYAKQLISPPQVLDSTISELLDNAIQQIQDSVQQFVDSSNGELWKTYYEFFPKDVREPTANELDETKPILQHIDTEKLHHFTIQTERWMGFFFNLGYELHQLKRIYTICEDQTIKVRRLVHNFKEKMEKTEANVWTQNHELKPDFNFLSISSAGIYDIILLHDWYACNAPEKSYKEMGFKDDEEFMEFRKKCNKISYNLRKNQYAQMLAVQKTKLEDRINEMQDLIQGETTLKYQDKYGKPDEEEFDDGQEYDPSKLSIFSDADLLLTELESKTPIDRSVKQNVARTFNRLVQFVNADAELKELESQQKQTREVQVDWLFKKFKTFIDADSELGELEKNSNNQDQKALVKKMFADFTAFIEAERLDFIKQNQGTGEEFDKIASFAMKKFKDFMQAESKIQKEEARSRQYRMDSETMVERTIAYLKDIGLIESPKDIEALATRSAVANSKVDSTVELNRIKLSKEALDQSIAKMTGQRNALQTIIDKIDEADKKVSALEDENRKLFNAAVLERNKQRKNRILMQRIENQNQIVELKGLAEKAKSSHLGEFRSLERLRNDVDRNRKSYDRYVSEFKEKIGLNKETVNQLMVGIYNRFQDEILNGAK